MLVSSRKMNDKLLVKYSKHWYIMYKLVYLGKQFPKSNYKNTKIFWIYVTNNEATDSSSSEDGLKKNQGVQQRLFGDG